MQGFILAILLTFSSALPQESKSISIFNVVKFPNDGCIGTGTNNGTCYTAEECSAIGGTNSGSCAEGYGVCCVVSLSCGETTSQNCTYLSMASTTDPTINPCSYKLCPMNNGICRIRLDFTSFTIAGPYVPQAAPTATTGGAIGQCRTDTFVASGSIGGSPVICGVNTGQHLYVDTDGKECATASFVFGGTSIARAYDIKVLQYSCTDLDNGGPPGCLQYLNSNTGRGTIASFNYPIGATTVTVGTAGTAVTHLANQDYDICFRRTSGSCALCLMPTVTIAPASYGLGVSAIAAMGAVDAACTLDFLEIEGAIGNTGAGVATAAPAAALRQTLGGRRICGALFAISATIAADTTICTGTVPFKIRFVADATEADVGAVGTTAEDTNNGIIGFSLSYYQQACP